ncbi:MAG: DUF2062 domain-containing protein [Proteobacteria bacterium]|nr:DUF2062 domain-containing protein [Pseudomonadota bacterium]MBU1419420.1 DUF2062 domain-containing protein [Pseudomonadota bacterium]MBU1456311.1 DUF2062 domain-containing protein [Pseudomonadota bacterium]
MNLKRTSRYYYLKFVRLKGDPQSLAGGTAIGTFFGITPIIPFHTLINLIVTFLTRTSTIAALLASLIVCNPFTYVPQYYLSTVIGNFITPYNLNWERIKSVLDILLAKPGFMESLQAVSNLGYEAVIVLLVGGSVLALPFTLISYFFSLRLFIKIREKRRERHVLN